MGGRELGDDSGGEVLQRDENFSKEGSKPEDDAVGRWNPSVEPGGHPPKGKASQASEKVSGRWDFGMPSG